MTFILEATGKPDQPFASRYWALIAFQDATSNFRAEKAEGSVATLRDTDLPILRDGKHQAIRTFAYDSAEEAGKRRVLALNLKHHMTMFGGCYTDRVSA